MHRYGYLIVGLALIAPDVAAQRAPADSVVWPLPPDAAVIQYTGAVASDHDLGRKRSFLGRLASSITGAQEQYIGVTRPHDVYVSDSGRVYFTNGMAAGFWVADPAEHAIRFVSPDGLATIGKAMGLAGEGDSLIYVADPRRHRVVAIDGDGGFVRAYGGEQMLLNPVDVAVGPGGERVYVADSYLHQVVIFDRLGTPIGRIGRNEGDLAGHRARLAASTDATAALPDSSPPSAQHGHQRSSSSLPSDLFENRGAGDGEFRYPAFVAVGPGGTLYVSDGLNFRVQAFTPDGEFINSFGRLGDGPGTFARPKGLAVDAAGYVYVVDAAFNNVQMFDREGRVLMAFGQIGGGAGELWLPVGVAVNEAGQIVVADRYNNRLQFYRFLGAPAGAADPIVTGSNTNGSR